MWVYIKQADDDWQVGFFVAADWRCISKHATEEAAARRVNYLNGGGT